MSTDANISELVGQYVSNDGTLFGEGEFHEPCYRPPGSDRDLDAPVGLHLPVGDREYMVVEFDRDYPLASPLLNRRPEEIRIGREWRMVQDLLKD